MRKFYTLYKLNKKLCRKNNYHTGYFHGDFNEFCRNFLLRRGIERKYWNY